MITLKKTKKQEKMILDAPSRFEHFSLIQKYLLNGFNKDISTPNFSDEFKNNLRV